VYRASRKVNGTDNKVESSAFGMTISKENLKPNSDFF
jgi:hypothetical protein